MPASSEPSTGSPRGTVAPQAKTIAAYPARSSAAVTSRPASTQHRNSVPSASIWMRRRSRCLFSILNSGIPYRSRPPGASARSNTVTACPALVSCWAAASPAGPDPITATFRPAATAAGAGRRGGTQPSAHARLMISTSTCLIETGSALMPSTQADSQGAGHNLPVNSGKLLVACSRSAAARQFPVRPRSFHSGIRLPSGQPWWQNGMPQSMQRPAWRSSSVAENWVYTSFQSRIRTSTGLRPAVRRGVVRKPLGSAINMLLQPSSARTPSASRPGLRSAGGRGHNGLVDVGAVLLSAPGSGQHSLVVLRHHPAEPLLRGRPVGQQLPGNRGAGVGVVPVQQVEQEGTVLIRERLDVGHLGVDSPRVWVQQVCDATGHAGREVPPDRPENRDAAAGHVLTTVISRALGQRRGARVPYAEPLPDHAAQQHLAARGAVSDDVSRDHVLLSRERCGLVRSGNDAAAGQALAEIVVCVAGQAQGDAPRQERA